ncbi:hypothetical protein [Hoeflea poritis]|uniref:DUF465 domain-containing protein n=1 Tax=Hoeflea poritis TaxID=2993659 RepID=A0ABT4VJ79_9HYPH|nr:hypothetical protein [Hoeflea poritis]MDA4844773.1 hypothetical protein [Hoeflea poritis]
MATQQEITGHEARLQMIQDEIDRRHSRIDADVGRARNLEKIRELRAERDRLRKWLAAFSR